MDYTAMNKGTMFIEVKYKEYPYRLIEVRLLNGKLYFYGANAYLKPISLDFIRNVQYLNDQLIIEIEGIFFTVYEQVDKITFKFSSIQDRKAFKLFLEEKNWTPANLSVLENGKSTKIYPVLVEISGNELIVYSEQGKIIQTIYLEQYPYIYDKQVLIISYSNRYYYLQFEQQTVPINLPTTMPNAKLISDAGNLFGSYEDNTFNGNKVDLFIQIRENTTISNPVIPDALLNRENQFQFIVQNRESITMLPAATYMLKRLGKDYFLKSKDGTTALLKLSTPLDIMDRLNIMDFPNQSNCLGYLEDGQPFEVCFQNGMFQLVQNANRTLLSINMSTINKIELLEPRNQPYFQKINLVIPNHQMELYIQKEEIKNVLMQTYKTKKQPLLEKVNVMTLFSSYGRQMDDFLLYHYFGQIISIREGINDLYKKFSNKKARNEKLLNFLYYGIQAQKKRMDIVSIYFPALLQQQDNTLLNSHALNIADAPYQQMQRKLLSINSQMLRHLNEVERSLTALSFGLYPQKDMQSYIQMKAENGYATAALTGIAGIFFPPLLISSALTGARSFLGKIEMQELEKIKEENRQQQIDFFISNGLDSFEHFCQVTLPYYINEVNWCLYQLMEQTKHYYMKHSNSQKAKEALFNELASLYTIKQLPIDESVIIPKQSVVNEIHKALSFHHVHTNNLLVEIKE